MAKNLNINALLQRQGILILDGGLATELEDRGASLNNDLWSARLLIENPALIRQVHYDFLVAGADIVISSSYQASIAGFQKAGATASEAIGLIKLSVDLACEARVEFLASRHSRDRLRPLVAASVGPYGACLADGSEYRGDYGLTKKELMNFHRPRLEILSKTKADLFAFETIPSQLEAEAMLELLTEISDKKAWLSFSCRDDRHVSHGEPFADCVEMATDHPQIIAVGVNCTRPEYVTGLLRSAGRSAGPYIAYPNSGECWHAEKHEWTGEGSQLDPADWVKAGARLVGGCCRVGTEQISRLRKTLIKKQG